jgi:hypothetical protein
MLGLRATEFKEHSAPVECSRSSAGIQRGRFEAGKEVRPFGELRASEKSGKGRTEE